MSTVASDSATTSGQSDRGKSEGKGKVERVNFSLFMEEKLYPSLYARLDTAFPEFGFVNVGGDWKATLFPAATIPIKVEHPNPDRINCYANRTWGFVIHGHHIIRWLDYAAGGSKPTGDNFLDAVKDLCKRAGIAFPEVALTPEEKAKAKVWEERRAMLEIVAEHCRKILWSAMGDQAREYLKARGFTDEGMREIGAGFYLYSALVKPLKDAGYDEATAKDAGVLWKRMEGYIVFPWHEGNGGILTLYGKWPGKPLPKMIDLEHWRYVREDAWNAWKAKPDEARAAGPWVEPNITKTLALFGNSTKNAPMYYDRARRKGHKTLVAVEGVSDAALLQLRGETRAVAYVGAQFSTEQVETLKRHQIEAVIICGDPDQGGAKGTESSVKALQKAGITAYVAPTLPDGLDPDEFLIRDGIEGWRSHVEDPTPGAVYLAGRLLEGITPKSPEIRRRGKVDEVLTYLATLSDDRDKTEVLKLLAGRTGFSVTDLRNMGKGSKAKDQKKNQGGKATDGGKARWKPQPDYVVQAGCIGREAADEKGNILFQPLAKFDARIAENITKDDGLTRNRFLKIEATMMAGGTAEAVIPAEKFTDLAWVTPHFGPEATIYPGRGARDELRFAIEVLSRGRTVDRTVYAHSGWRMVGDSYSFLHCGGAIGAGGNNPGVGVELNDKLSGYSLPSPPEGAELVEAIRAVLRILDIAEESRPNSQAVAATGVCIPFRAAIGDPLGNVWFDGLSGALKTEWAANVLLRFNGVGFSRDNVPGSWTSSDNALEIQAHTAKDVIFLVDDFRPPESPPNERAKYEARASRFLRSAANRQGRDRAKPDGGLQQTKYPRGLVLVTGETLPSDTSVIARTIVLEFIREDKEAKIVGTLNPETMRRCSADGAAGLYAAAMSGFLKWLAPQYEAIKAGVRGRADRRGDRWREEMVKDGVHPRTPELMADLFIGFEEFSRFAVEKGACTEEQVRLDLEKVEKGLRLAASEQPEHQQGSDPIARFFELLPTVLAQRTAVLADATTGEAPKGIEQGCGWEGLRYTKSDGSDGVNWSIPHGAKRVGWVRDGHAFLLLEAAFGVVQDLAGRGGNRLPFGAKTLSARLKAKGFLRETEKGSNTVKKFCEKTYHRVLVLDANQIVNTKVDVNDLKNDTTPPAADEGGI